MANDTISIEPLNCGTLTASFSMFESDGTDDALTIPVPSWLIRHGDTTALFDCGMHAALTEPGELLDIVSLFFGVGLDANQLIAGALEQRQVDPADIDIVVLSHLHFDHVGGLAQLPNARVVVQSAEWAAGFDDDLASANSFSRDEFDLGHDVVTIDGEHDLFGDGRVSCLPTPGHTPGHQSLRVRLADREVVLCGDCAYFERTLDGGPLPGIGHDHEQQAASIAKLVALRSAGALLIPGHDPATFAALPDRLV